MKYLAWLLKAAIFFTLFAFALNNLEDVTLNFFFHASWRAPMVLVVLTAFAAGIVVGVLGMVPRWWMHRSAARRAQQAVPPPPAPATTATPAPTTVEHVPHGL